MQTSYWFKKRENSTWLRGSFSFREWPGAIWSNNGSAADGTGAYSGHRNALTADVKWGKSQKKYERCHKLNGRGCLLVSASVFILMDFCPCVERNLAEVVGGVSQNPDKKNLDCFPCEHKPAGPTKMGPTLRGWFWLIRNWKEWIQTLILGKRHHLGTIVTKKNE